MKLYLIINNIIFPKLENDIVGDPDFMKIGIEWNSHIIFGMIINRKNISKKFLELVAKSL